MAVSTKNQIATIRALRFLEAAQDDLYSSLKRVASGERIHRAADDPAGLVISEKLRAQIASIEQGINNSEISISMVQTAENALAEVQNLLIHMRQLALSAANTGTNDENLVFTLQAELENALESIDRVSRNTQFAGKTLLDGSNGVSGVANGEDLFFMSASVNTQTSPLTGFVVNVTQTAKQATHTGTIETVDVSGLVLSITEGGKTVTIIGERNDDAKKYAQKIQEAIETNGLQLDVEFTTQGTFLDVQSVDLTLRHQKFGSRPSFELTSSEDGVLGAEENVKMVIQNGLDVQGTIQGEGATGRGHILKGNWDNRQTEGLVLSYTGKELGEVGNVIVKQNALTFQIGPNQEQQAQILIENTGANTFSRGLPNDSGFENLRDIDVTTAQGAKDTILLVDDAMNRLSHIRSTLGAFQKNTLQTNVENLEIASENLNAAESVIRDSDVAFEVLNFVKNRMLNDAASAAIAQANRIHVRSLSKILESEESRWNSWHNKV